MSERKTRPASPETAEKVLRAVKQVMVEHGPLFMTDACIEKVHCTVGEVLGPYDKRQVDGFGVRFTKLEAEPDGVHEYVTIHF